MPMLGVYDSSTDTEVEVHTNANTKPFGAILLQKYAAAKHFQPIVYYSKKFKKMLQNYSAIDCEILVIVEALWHLQPYLYGKKFLVHIEHCPLYVLICTIESFPLPTTMG